MKNNDLVAYNENGCLVIDSIENEFLRWSCESDEASTIQTDEDAPIENILLFAENFHKQQTVDGTGSLRLLDSPEGFWEATASEILRIARERLGSVEYFCLFYDGFEISWIHPKSPISDIKKGRGIAEAYFQNTREEMWEQAVSATARRILGSAALYQTRPLPSYIRNAK